MIVPFGPPICLTVVFGCSRMFLAKHGAMSPKQLERICTSLSVRTWTGMAYGTTRGSKKNFSI